MWPRGSAPPKVSRLQGRSSGELLLRPEKLYDPGCQLLSAPTEMFLQLRMDVGRRRDRQCGKDLLLLGRGVPYLE